MMHRTRITLVSMLSVCLLGAQAWDAQAEAEAESDPKAFPTDERLRDLELKLHENVQTCIKRSSGGGPYCDTSERQRLERSFPFRGTRQYVRQYYLPLDTKSLFKTRDELRETSKVARSERDYWVDTPRPAGELTKEMLQAELTLVDKELDVRKRKGKNAMRDLTRDLERMVK